MLETPEVLTIPIESPEPEEVLDDLRELLLADMSPEDEKELYSTASSDYDAALLDRAEWESRIPVWDNQYNNEVPKKNFPWEGASNLNVPLTMLGIETLKPRLIESVLGETPPIIVQPVESADEKLKDRVELFLNWQLLTELGIEKLVPESAHLFLNPGLVIAKVYWKVDRIRRKFIRKFGLSVGVEEIIQSLFGTVHSLDFKEIEKNVFTATLQDSPNVPPQKLEIRLRFDEKYIHALVSREDITEKPSVEFVDVLDFIVPVRGGGDVQKLPFCAQRLWLTENDLRQKVKLKRFDANSVEELIRSGNTGESLDTDQNRIQETRDATEGIEGQGDSSVQNQQYEVIEECRRWDVDGDGFEEEIIFWWSPALKEKLLGWDYLDNVYAHGKRPYVIGRFLPIPFRFFPISFPEMVRGLQEEINTIHNQRIDFGTLQNMPWGFVRATNLLAPMTIKLAPGRFIPIGDPNADVNIPRFQGSSAFGQAEEALNYQYFERLTGIMDMVLGRQPNRVGATRTATGVASLLSEAGLRFKTIMRSFQIFWTEIAEHVLALDQQYLPPGKEFRVTGRIPEMIKLGDRFDIAGRFDIHLSASTESLNRQIRRDDSTVVLQSLLNPGFIQTNLVGMKGIRRALEDFLKAYGREADAYLEPEVQDMVVRTPEEELSLIAAGQPVRPSPLENIPMHLQTHMEQRNAPEVIAVLKPEQLAALDAHISDTLRLGQSMMMAQALPARGAGAQIGQQANNAEIGRNNTQPPESPPTNTTLGGPEGGEPQGY